MRVTSNRAASLVCLLLVLALGSGCGRLGDEGEVRESGASALPSGSLEAWATYGDYLVEWQVDSERRLPPTPDERAADEGTITRLVTVRTSRTGWKRPSAPDELTAPATLDVASGGWAFHGKKEKRFDLGDGPRLEVGHRYLAVLTFTDLSAMSTEPRGAEWIALDHVALDDGRVVARAADRGEPAGLDEAIGGKTLAEVGALVAATPVDPAAKRYLELDPVVRFQRAADDTIASSSYTPGPGPGEKE